MKQLLPVLSVLLLAGIVAGFTAVPASASGINLSWGDCGTTGTADKTSTCLSNSGSNLLFASFDPPVDMAQFNGMAGVLDITTDTDPAPAWWNLQTAGCRAGLISANFDFTGGPFTCTDPWNGSASGGLNFDLPFPAIQSTVATAPATNHARVKAVCAVATPFLITTGTEYYGFRVTILNTKTTGAGNCAGCLNKACIVFNSILVTQPAGVGDFIMSNAINSKQITWQGSGADCASVPVLNRSWGQIKSLYR